MKRKSVVFSISMSPKEKKALTELSREEGLTRSQTLREAFRQYRFEKTFSRLQIKGQKIAIKLGIRSEDDVERIAG